MNNGNINNISQTKFNDMKYGYNNYSEAYAQNHTQIGKMDFKNKCNIMHNNIGDTIMTEKITEYNIHIDSSSRDMDYYTNPFSFTVAFGSEPHPRIDRKFMNVKYIKIHGVILPKTNVIEIGGTVENPTYELSDSLNYLTNNKFLVLKIKELKNNKIFSTNQFIGDDSIILYYDTDKGLYNTMWYPSVDSRVFPNSLLRNLNKLTIQITDDDGDQLNIFDQNGKVINIKSIINKMTDEINKEERDPTDNSYLSILKINKVINMSLEITLGVVESELNTNVKFER